MHEKLEGVSETLLIPHWAKAVELKQPRPIIKDYKPMKIMKKIDYDFSKFENQEPTQLSIVIRSNFR